MLNGARMRARERELREKAQQTALDAAARAREQEAKLQEAARNAKEADQQVRLFARACTLPATVSLVNRMAWPTQMLARKMRDDFEAKKATWKITATTTEQDGSKRKKGASVKLCGHHPPGLARQQMYRYANSQAAKPSRQLMTASSRRMSKSSCFGPRAWAHPTRKRRRNRSVVRGCHVGVEAQWAGQPLVVHQAHQQYSRVCC